MACDATARLYDVDEDSVIFKRSKQKDSYDQGSVTFSARKGALIDLDKLHESIWATRLSGGTRSGIVSLEATAIGSLVQDGGKIVLKVDRSEAEFILLVHSKDEHARAFEKLQKLVGESKRVRVTGQVDKYFGQWPKLLSTQPPKTRRILVTNVLLEE